MPKTSEEIREGYRQRLILSEFPQDSDPIEFRTKSGTVVAKGYERVVIGDRGPYVEFSDGQMVRENMFVPSDEMWRFSGRCFYIEYRTKDEADVKIYLQKFAVRYADYEVGKWYISPFDLTTDQWPILVAPLEKR